MSGLESQDTIFTYTIKSMYKKIPIDQDREFPIEKLGVKESDGPDYPLFEFKGFGSRPVKDLVKTPTKNGSRKSSLIQDKLDSLIASTTGFLWLLFGWPISILITNDEGTNNAYDLRNVDTKTEYYFDHHHLVRALIENLWRHAPVAIYQRKKTGIDVFDRLSDNNAMILMGLRANATDNSANAGTKDFHVIREIMEKDGIVRTTKNIDKLLEVSGVYERYPKKGHKTTIGGIRNAIKETKKRSLRVFNTTEAEIKDWLKLNKKFGKNKPSTEDGVMCYHKILDSSFYYRYANDILKWAFFAFVKGETARVCASSKAICEHEIEAEREEMIDTIEDILDNTINWYISWVENQFNGMVTLPKVELNKLPLELYWVPQIDGETEAIRVEF